MDLKKVFPDDLSDGFAHLGLRDGQSVMLHASLEAMGIVDGGAATILHRLIRTLGSNGSRHIPFIPELQPDKEKGTITHRSMIQVD